MFSGRRRRQTSIYNAFPASISGLTLFSAPMLIPPLYCILLRANTLDPKRDGDNGADHARGDDGGPELHVGEDGCVVP